MQAKDLSGSQLDAVFAALQARFPDISVRRLQVSHPGADDDNLWFIRSLPGATAEVQLEAFQGGKPPFLLEGDGVGQRAETTAVDEAVAVITDWLHGKEDT